MERPSVSSAEPYMDRIYRVLMFVAPVSALIIGLLCTGIRLAGFSDGPSWPMLAAFDAAGVAFCAVGMCLVRRFTRDEGGKRDRILRAGKICLYAQVLVQYSFINFLMPTRDGWVYAVFFILLSVLFLDHKYVLLMIAGVAASLAAAWSLRPSVLLAADGAAAMPDTLLRVLFLAIMSLLLWVLTYLADTKVTRELRRQAERDPLTGLNNRRAMDRMLRRLLSEDGECAVLLCDLDDFHTLNDTYGHDAGDQMLSHAASLISGSIRDGDMVFRSGSEEFAVMIRSGKREAFNVAHRIRRLVEETPLYHGDDVLNITVTIGLAARLSGESADAWLKRAEKKLQEGKQTGKNKVVL